MDMHINPRWYETGAIMQKLESGCGLAYWLYDCVSGHAWVSPRAGVLLGLKEGVQSSIKRLSDNLDDIELARVNEARSEALAGRAYEITYFVNSSGKGRRWILERTSIEFDGSDRPQNIVALLTDVSFLQSSPSNINEPPNYDSLTSLPNVFLLKEHIGHITRKMKRNFHHAAVIFIGLDKIKQIKDNVAHDISDELLIMVAERIKRSLRESDFVSKLADDEFAVVLDGVENDCDAGLVGLKLIEVFDIPFSIRSEQVSVSASVGITMLLLGVDADEVLRRVNAAMCESKRRGGKMRINFCDIV